MNLLKIFKKKLGTLVALGLIVGILTLPLTGCSFIFSGDGTYATPPTLAGKGNRKGNQSGEQTDSKKLHDFDLSYFVGGSDILTSYYTYDDPKSFYTDWPTEGLHFAGEEDYNRAVDSCQQCIDYLEELDRNNLTEEEQRLLDDMLFDLKNKQEIYKYFYYTPQLSPLAGRQVTYPMLISLIQFEKKADVDRYIQILEDYYDYFSKLVEVEKVRSAKGIGWSDDCIDLIIKDCQKMLDNQNTHFMKTTFESRVGAMKLSKTEEKSFLKKNQELLEEKFFPAYEMIIKEMEALKGKCNDAPTLNDTAEGKKYYSALLRYKTGMEITPEEGIKVLQEEIDAVYAAYYPQWKTKGNIFSFGGLDYDEAVKWTERFTKDHFPALSENTVSVYQIPEEFADSIQPATYYLSPVDNYKKHQVWLNTKMIDNSQYNMYTLISHEMYPGHLYQHQYHAEHLDNYYQTFATSVPYAEGWAVFSEHQMLKYAPFDREMAEISWMSHLLYSILIAARLSMGVEIEGWDKDRCFTYLKKYGQDDTEALDKYWDRITAERGYALEYAFGYIYTSDIINTAVKELEGVVSEDDVMLHYLDLGCCPFKLLKEEMDKYVKEQKG